MAQDATAKRFGICGACGEETAPGQPLSYGGGTWMHTQCVDDKDTLIAARHMEPWVDLDEPLASWEVLCGTCWLIHRKGVCDRE